MIAALSDAILQFKKSKPVIVKINVQTAGVSS